MRPTWRINARGDRRCWPLRCCTELLFINLVGLPTIKQAVGVKPKPGLKFDPRAFLAKPGEGRAASSYATGQVIFAQGDPADAVFYVQSGRVKLSIGAKKRWSGSIRPPISSVKRA